MTSKHGVSSHSNIITEVSRKNIIGKNKSMDPDRYNRRLNYRITNAGAIDESRLINEDIIVAKVPVKDYVCTVAFKNVIKNLLDVIKSQPNPNVNLQSVIRAVNRAIDDSDILVDCSCPDFCLHGDTEIELIDGSCKISEVMNKFDNGEELFTYSIDNDGYVRIGRIINVWISGYFSEFVKVTLDNGKSILTTPDHRYMLDNMKYIEANKLESGMRLIKVESGNKKSTSIVCSVESVSFDEKVPVYDMTVEKYGNFYTSAGAIIHNCYRFAYFATRYGIKFGKPETRPSKITNPHDKLGATCKHLSALLANKKWLVKLSSVINEVIKKHADDIRYKYKLEPDEFIINVSGRPSSKTKRNLRMANVKNKNSTTTNDDDADVNVTNVSDNGDEELIPKNPFAIKGGTLDGSTD